MLQVAILGPGGVGGFLAGALERAGTPVTIIARESTAAAVERGGIRVESVRLGAFTATPRAVSELDATGMTLVVATKATGLEAALERVHGEPELVVPMLNGLEHLDLLRARFGERAVAAAIRIESDHPEPGRYVQTSGFLGIDVAPRSDAVERFAETFEAAGIPVRILDSEPQVMWGKLVRLNALACTTSAWNLPLGPIREDGLRRSLLRSCIEEGAAVARADGADIAPETTMAELDNAHATLGSSMQRDIAAGRAPELDAIPGAVLRAARRHGLECPTIERLAAKAAARAGAAA